MLSMIAPSPFLNHGLFSRTLLVAIDKTITLQAWRNGPIENVLFGSCNGPHHGGGEPSVSRTTPRPSPAETRAKECSTRTKPV